MEKKITVPAIPPVWNFNDLLKVVPADWRDAKICVGDGLQRSFPVKRVVFHQNSSGSMVVVLCPDELKIYDWSTGIAK